MSEREEFGHTYTVYNLTHYPEQNLNPRPGHAGPVSGASDHHDLGGGPSEAA